MVYDKHADYINGFYYGFKKDRFMRKNWYEERITLKDETVDVDLYFYDAYGLVAQAWNELEGIPYYVMDGWMDGRRWMDRQRAHSIPTIV